MKRWLVTCLLLVACAAPPSLPVRETPQKPAPTAPAAKLPPVFADNPDEPFRYHLPVPAAPEPMRPWPVEEIRLQNGLQAFVVTRNEAPVVTVNVVIRWRIPPSVHRMALTAVLLDGASKQTKSLRQTMQDHGLRIDLRDNRSSGQIFEFSVPSTHLETSLAALFESLSHPISSVDNADYLRGRFPDPQKDQGDKTIYARLEQALYPAGHPYHDQARFPDPVLLRFDDVARFRDAELRPEAITICAVGSVSRSDLEPMLNRATSGFKAPSTPFERKLPPRSTLTGVVLSAAPPEEPLTMMVFPGVPMKDRDFVAYELMWQVVHELMVQGRGESRNVPERWHIERPGETFWAITTRGNAQEAGAFANEMMDALKRVAAGDFSAELLARVRRDFAAFAIEKADTLPGMAYAMADSILKDGPPDLLVKLHEDALDTSTEGIMRVAQKWLSKGALRMVAAGDTTALKNVFAKFDLRPVVIDAGKGNKK